jgi:hypothetical protein
VIVVGVSGSGIVTVDREDHALSAGVLVFVPKGGLTLERERLGGLRLPPHPVHRRRRPLQMGLRQGA